MGFIKDNLFEIRNKIDKVVKKVDRDSKEIIFLVVIKIVDVDLVNEVMREGIIFVGENKF